MWPTPSIVTLHCFKNTTDRSTLGIEFHANNLIATVIRSHGIAPLAKEDRMNHLPIPGVIAQSFKRYAPSTTTLKETKWLPTISKEPISVQRMRHSIQLSRSMKQLLPSSRDGKPDKVTRRCSELGSGRHILWQLLARPRDTHQITNKRKRWPSNNRLRRNHANNWTANCTSE